LVTGYLGVVGNHASEAYPRLGLDVKESGFIAVIGTCQTWGHVRLIYVQF